MLLGGRAFGLIDRCASSPTGRLLAGYDPVTREPRADIPERSYDCAGFSRLDDSLTSADDGVALATLARPGYALL